MHAGFFVRLAAYLMDSLIVGVVLAVVVRFPIWISTLIVPNNIVVRDLIFEYSIKDIVIYVLSAMYFILLTYKTGATIGKRVLHLKVVSAEDRKPTLFEVIYRETVGRFLSALILYAGYFMIGLQSEKRGLHDLMSDTQVVYCHKKDMIIDTPVEYREVTPTYAQASYAAPEEIVEVETQVVEPTEDEE